MYQSGAGATTFATALANAVLTTNGSNVPSLSTTLPSGLTIPNSYRSYASTVSAAGSNQGTATALTNEINTLTTVTAGQGVVLPTAVAGLTIIVINKGANTVNIYPATGAAIDSLGANAAITLVSSGWIQFNAVSATQWYSTANLSIGGVSSANNMNGGTAGALVYQTGAGATNFLAIGGSSYVLTSSGTLPQWSAQSTLTAGSATTATNIASGAAGSLLYQSGVGATTTLAIGSSSSILTSNGSAPLWSSPGTLSVGSATSTNNIVGGAAGSVVYQSGSGATTTLALGTTNYILTAGASVPQHHNGRPPLV